MSIKRIHSKICILIVDDQAVERKVIHMVLRDEFSQILTADSPIKALDMIRKQQVNILLSDYEMPEMNGTDFIREALKVNPNFKCILITSHNEKDIILEGLRAGIKEYIHKPIQREFLLHAVHQQVQAIVLEEQLQNQYLLEHMDYFPDIIFKMDHQGHFSYFNRAIKKILGFEPQDLVGQHFSVLIHPEDVEKYSRDKVLPLCIGVQTGDKNAPPLIDERRTGHRCTRNLKIRLISKNDPNISKLCEGTFFGQMDSFGSQQEGFDMIEGTIGIIRDVSHEFHHEETKKILHQTLQEHEHSEKLNREYALSLQAAENYAKEARRHVEAKSQFLARMSHEIRSPMNGVIGITDVLMRSKLNDDQKEYVQIIQQSGSRLLEVINEILDFSKLESGKVVLRRQPLCVAEVVQEAYQALHYIYKQKKLSLEVNIKVPLSSQKFVLGDDRHLYRIIINLLSNALKFTQQGGVTISVIERHQNSLFSTYEISVCDTGIGIPADLCSKIFEEFSQVDSTNTRKYQGTGLGLTICKQLVNLMDGRIHVESLLGHGSTFTVVIPFDHGEKLQNKSSHEELKKRSPQKCDAKILIVDDEPLNLFIAKKILQELDFVHIDLCEDPTIVMERCKNNTYDLIFMDLQMPNMDGIEVCSTLRNLNFQMPIIGLTADTSEGTARRCTDQGMNDCIHKPYRIEEILRTIEKWL